VPEARRILIVHTIGAAAFAAAAAKDHDTAIPAAQLRGSFHRSLGWLIVGLTQEPIATHAGY